MDGFGLKMFCLLVINRFFKGGLGHVSCDYVGKKSYRELANLRYFDQFSNQDLCSVLGPGRDCFLSLNKDMF